MNQNNNGNKSNSSINEQNEEMCRALAGLAAYSIGIPNSHYDISQLINKNTISVSDKNNVDVSSTGNQE